MCVSEDIQVGCRELRAKRYISDGFCTSTKPINEVVCTGTCLPIRDLPWYAEFVKYWAKSKYREWQCEEGVVRRKSVHLLCRNGQYRTYRIKVVKSCTCKKLVDQHNRTVPSGGQKQKQKKKKKKRRKGEGGEGGGGENDNKKRKGKKRRRKQLQRKMKRQQQQQEQQERGEGEGEKEEVEEVEEVVDVSQALERQEAKGGVRKEGRGGKKKSRKRKRQRRTGREAESKAETNSDPNRGQGKAVTNVDTEQRDRDQALLSPR